MKVVSLETRLVDVPLARPVGTAIHSIRSVGCVLVEVRTVDSVIGEGFAFTIDGHRLRSLQEMIVGFEPLVVGRSAHETEGIWHDIFAAANPMGVSGTTISALAAIDVALWDAVGRTLDQPLHRLWGSCRDQVDTYASSGLWLNQSVSELVEQATTFVDQGFRAMKIRVGSERMSDDVARVRAVRDVIGPGIALLADANQGFGPKDAIRLARALEPFDLAWFEEPVPSHDHEGHARVRDAIDIPVATGETEYTRFGLQSMLMAGAADVLMPDLQRIGGFSEFRKASAVASARNIPVSSHFFTEQSLCLAGSLANCISVEHVDWFAPLFNESMHLVDGRLVVPDRPGTGFTFAL